MDEYLNAAREEGLPDWDPEREYRLLEAVLEQIDQEESAYVASESAQKRRRWVWGTTGALLAAAAAALFVYLGSPVGGLEPAGSASTQEIDALEGF